MVELRLHVIPLTDEALDANGDPGFAFAVTPAEFAQLVERVNPSFQGTDIHFVFDPETDWWPRADSLLNSDAPGMRDRGNSIAAEVPGKVVCFLRWGASPNGPTGNGNAYPPPGAGPKPPHVDDLQQDYVALPNRIDPNFGLLNQGNGSFVAHELGHYLGLYHTFPGWTDRRGPVYKSIEGSGTPSAQAADQAVIDYVAAGGGAADALDGDGLSDTPPDPSPVLYQAHGQDVCAQPQITVSGAAGSSTMSVTFQPDPDNVMSYFRTCGPAGAAPPPAHFSPQQIQRMHATLQHSSRLHLTELPCPADFHDLPVDRLQRAFNFWVHRRQWPATLSIARHDDALFASGSFQRGHGRLVRHLMTDDALRSAVDAERAKFGRPQQRPHQVSVVLTNQGPRYTAVWAPSAGEWIAEVALDAAAYEARWHEHHAAEYVQVDLVIAGGSTLRFTSVWERRPCDEYASYWGMTAQQYRDRFDEFWPKGLRPVRFCRYEQPGVGERFAAVWERLPGRWAHYFGMDHHSYQEHWADFALERGLRLHQLHSYERWFSAVWHDPGQFGWRRCGKCQVLTFAAPVAGPCAAGGVHDHSGSRDYVVPHNADGVGQPNWRWCRKCHGMTFGGAAAGPCAAGGTHDHQSSGDYRVPLDWNGPGEDGWRWCRKCQSLAFDRSPQGPCATGGQHDPSGSGSYRLPNVVYLSLRVCGLQIVMSHQVVGQAHIALPPPRTPSARTGKAPTGTSGDCPTARPRPAAHFEGVGEWNARGRRKAMGAARWAMAAGVATALVGCGVPIQSSAHFASGVEPPGHVTFAWNDESDHVQGDSRLEDNAFYHARLHEAVEWELNLRGIRRTQSDPALLVHHHLSLADHEMEQEFVDESGYRTSESFEYESGSVVLHVVDAATGHDLWVAWAQANVEAALTGPDAMRAWVYDLVGEMFRSWPVPPRAAHE